MAGFKTISDTIFTELDKVRTVDLKAGSVYNYEPKTIENFPAIIIIPTNGTDNIIDTCTNEVDYNFLIGVYDEIQTGIATVEDNMRSLASTVIERLKDLPTSISYSNGKTLRLTFDYSWGYTDAQEPLRVFEITAKFMALEDK